MFKPHPLTSSNPFKQLLKQLLGCVVVMCLLLSQFLGLIHAVHHPSAELRSHDVSIESQISYESEHLNFTETHFGSVAFDHDSPALDAQSCKLFDSLMLWVCLATGAIVLLNFIQSRFIFKLPCIISNTLVEHLSYSSRAPPLMSC